MTSFSLSKPGPVIQEFFRRKMTPEIQKLYEGAMFDLHFGPTGTDDSYPGYVQAIQKLREWGREEIGDCWVSVDGEVSQDEPAEEDLSEWKAFSGTAAYGIVFKFFIQEGGM